MTPYEHCGKVSWFVVGTLDGPTVVAGSGRRVGVAEGETVGVGNAEGFEEGDRVGTNEGRGEG